MTHLNLVENQPFDPDVGSSSSLPESHSAWLVLNGEVEGVDPTISINVSGEGDEVLTLAIREAGKMGGRFYRWTRLSATSGILDAWTNRPPRVGRVGYGAEIRLSISPRSAT